MKNVEIDFVVKDSLKALQDYQEIFHIRVVEQTDFPTGLNEVVFQIDETQFHMLDENPDYHLNAPSPDHPQTIWFNVTVDNIEKTWEKAMETGAESIQPITEMEEMGVSNAIFVDTHGYTWMLHQIHQEVSLEEREEFFKEKFDL